MNGQDADDDAPQHDPLGQLLDIWLVLKQYMCGAWHAQSPVLPLSYMHSLVNDISCVSHSQHNYCCGAKVRRSIYRGAHTKVLKEKGTSPAKLCQVKQQCRVEE